MRKNIKKIAAIGISGLLSAGLLVGSIDYASHMFSLNNEVVAKEVEKVTDTIKDNASAGVDSTDTSKQETVYATLDAAGSPTDVIVSDWLKNSGKGKKIDDVSELSDIANTKGDEEFSQNGDNITWDTKDKDIYYQGKTDKEMPVGMTISYKLDGKDISPEELAGKSGKLEMNIRYTNSSKKSVKINGKDTDIYTPFIMVTGMILPVDSFKNITIDNGDVLSEGDNNIVVAYGMPGLSESLDLKNLSLGKDVDLDINDLSNKITDTVKITADVNNFEMNSSYTVATSDLFNKIDLEDIGSTDKLTDKIDELTSAAGKLVDGSDKIHSNLSKLDNKFDEYSNAIDTLDKSVGTLNKGAVTLKSGVTTYTKGTDKLLEGVSDYTDGTDKFSKGVKSYTKNTKKLVNAVGQLKEGTGKLDKGSDTFDENLNKYVNTVNQILSSDTILSVTGGIETLHNGVTDMQKGVSGLSGGVKTLKSGVESVKGGIDKINEASSNITKYSSEVDGYLAELKKLYDNASDENEKQQIYSIMTYVKTAQAAGEGINEATKSDGALSQGASNVSTGLDSVSTGLVKLSSGLDTMEKGTSDKSDIGSLGDNIDKLQTAGNDIVNGYGNQLDKGIKSLNKSVKEMYKAGNTLVGNNKTLDEAADELIKNSKVIDKNSNKITSGSGKLREGVKTLASGTGKLLEGVGTLVTKTGDVSDAIGKLSDGAGTLAEGVSKLNKDGIEMIADAVNEILDSGDGFRERLDVITKESAEYNSFSGIADDMDGSVKFIMSTEEIKTDK